MGDISEDIQGIDTAVKVLGSRMDELNKKNLEDRKSALADFQKLCEASVAAVQKEARYKSVFGDMKTAESAKVFAGVATKELRGGVDHTFGDCDIGSRGMVFMGAGDNEAMLGFFGQARNQPSMYGANGWCEATNAAKHKPRIWQVPLIEGRLPTGMSGPFVFLRDSESRVFEKLRREGDDANWK
ncbi:hypothetical protein DBV05_g7847 [Lasiodiplodia theobromae]|uniref:Uncharacterized protein n=1 Tax=Lasiodiplodia theobromae TaxID=45133 RepID=A0A5N5D729_9PEZI|nr:hypothetical protein DBV05_g7847 [Lasiodiplodia theobromae]